jgi:hypothetical protein
MEWTRSETLALAASQCTSCHGLGLRLGKRGGTSPCHCVMRSIFRACYRRFRQCATKEKSLTQVNLEYTGGMARRNSWGRKDEEYMADFLLVSKRTLTEEQHKIFRMHFLLGADYNLCCAKLKLDKGAFFHHIYRIESTLGRVFRELEPFALFPLDEYFKGVKPEDVTELRMRKVVQMEATHQPLSALVPLQKAA